MVFCGKEHSQASTVGVSIAKKAGLDSPWFRIGQDKSGYWWHYGLPAGLDLGAANAARTARY